MGLVEASHVAPDGVQRRRLRADQARPTRCRIEDLSVTREHTVFPLQALRLCHKPGEVQECAHSDLGFLPRIGAPNRALRSVRPLKIMCLYVFTVVGVTRGVGCAAGV